jgi:hypothetical protein
MKAIKITITVSENEPWNFVKDGSFKGICDQKVAEIGKQMKDKGIESFTIKVEEINN